MNSVFASLTSLVHRRRIELDDAGGGRLPQGLGPRPRLEMRAAAKPSGKFCVGI